MNRRTFITRGGLAATILPFTPPDFWEWKLLAADNNEFPFVNDFPKETTRTFALERRVVKPQRIIAQKLVSHTEALLNVTGANLLVWLWREKFYRQLIAALPV